MIEIKIVLDENGQLQLSGNFEDKLRVLGMLDFAKALVLGQPVAQAKPTTPPILLARGAIPNGRG